jgi:hypothetical protein
MKYKIKQLKDLRKSEYAFMWWEMAKDKFNIDDYEVVYEGEIEGTHPEVVLDRLFEIFNIKHPEDYRGHSLSVSDVVELDGVDYYCDSIGWVNLSEV